MGSFAYYKRHQAYFSSQELVSMAQVYRVVQKPNGVLNATRHTG